MAERFTPEERSRIMSLIKGRETKPEKLVRRLLHNMGYRFKLHDKNLPGKPDIVLPRHKKTVFVHGCFWHGHQRCKRAKRPATHKVFWNNKIDGNINRDKKVRRQLKALNWQVLVVWQCQTRVQEELRKRLGKFMLK